MLKPCPFCGYQPHYKTETDPMPPHAQRVWIKCTQCRQSQVCSDWYGGDLGTTEACWNKRFDEPNKHSSCFSTQIVRAEAIRLHRDGIIDENGKFTREIKPYQHPNELCAHGKPQYMDCQNCYPTQNPLVALGEAFLKQEPSDSGMTKALESIDSPTKTSE